MLCKLNSVQDYCQPIELSYEHINLFITLQPEPEETIHKNWSKFKCAAYEKFCQSLLENQSEFRKCVDLDT